MVEQEGRGLALTGRRHPNPIADCSHTAGKEEQRGKEKRMEISKWRAEEKQEEREGKRQTRLTVGVRGKVLVQVRAVLRSCTPQKEPRKMLILGCVCTGNIEEK